jgi:hypothetical protein
MIVKKASYLSFQRHCLLQITDGTRAVEQFPLKLGRDGIPSHHHGRPQASQDLLLFVGAGGVVVAILSRSVLLCSEHLTRPFCGRRQHDCPLAIGYRLKRPQAPG